GTVAIREGAAGILGSTASHNVLGACYLSPVGFTRAPWLVVTAGDLKLRTPSDPMVAGTAAAAGVGVKGQIVPGWLNNQFQCVLWIVWSKSTVASTLEIRGSDATGAMLGAGAAHGPQINVEPWASPGRVRMEMRFGSWQAAGTEFFQVVNAIKVFKSNPVVVAVSNPEIMRGLAAQTAGNVTITEADTHQFTNDEHIIFTVVPANQRDILPSVYFETNRDVPVISTNAASTGLIAHFDGFANSTQFAIGIDQRAFVPVVGAWVPGVITASSMHYTTTTDAAYGNVMLKVCTGDWTEIEEGPFTREYHGWLCDAEWDRADDSGPYAEFSHTISNAHVVSTGLFPSMSVAAGYKFRETSPYKTFGTLVVTKGTYITNKVYIGPQFQGKAIEFWQRNGKTGTWVKRTTGRVDGKGYAYWSTIPPMLSGTGFARYVYYRAYFAGTSEVAAAYSQTITRVVVK
ncbi:MAG: hypothetical protein MUQ56_12490, partial [Thermoleophilia bacterium]|nr:hypothetical protein [Thermoleophilia bacterium]